MRLTQLTALLFLIISAPLAASEVSYPEEIPLYRLGRTIPAVESMSDAQAAMSMADSMTTIQAVARRHPSASTDPREPFCQGDCIEIQTVARFEAKPGVSTLPTCDVVREGLSVAAAAWSEFQAGTARLREMTAELEAAQGAERAQEILRDLNTLITRLNALANRIRSAYPQSFNTVDRRVVFEWTAAPTRFLNGWPRHWVGQALALDMTEAWVRGYTWHVGEGQLTEIGGIDSTPASAGRGMRFAMDATPVQICSEGRDVALAGYLTLEFGIFDTALSAWRTNARTTVKSVLKGNVP